MAKKNKISKEIESLSTSNLNDFQKGLSRIIHQYSNIYTKQKLINRLTRANTSLTGTLTHRQKQLLNTKIKQLKASNRLYDVDYRRKELISTINNDILSGLKSAYSFFEAADSSIKSSALNLGLTRNLSEQYRDNLIESSRYAARLGLNIESLTRAQQAYNNEVNTTVLLSNKSLQAVAAITQGTALTADETGTLVGQFKLLGKNASEVKSFVEDTSIETTNMGLNLNKVLKDVSTNFRQIQSYNFSNGINGIQKMAMYANMYRMNITSAFNAIDKARTLEGAVEMSAKLMVMGGEFTKQNMFELGFMARNKPEEFIKKMAEMSKGVYFFNKQTGEFQATAFDLDRLRAVSEATNIPFQELSETARRLSEINLAKSQLASFNEEDKTMIANMAEMSKQGKFTVSVGRDVIDVRNLTQNQIELIKQQEKSLEKRAKDALTFDQEFSTLIAETKTLFLPILKQLNTVLRYVQDGLTDTGRIVVGGIGLLLTTQLKPLLSNLFKLIGLAKAQSTMTMAGGVGGGIGKGGTALSGLGKAAGGALAFGGAFLAASYGITMIADSFKELDPNQLDALTKTIVTMGISIPASMLAISVASKISAPGLGIFALGLGAITLAAMGIGKGVQFASDGLSKLFSSFDVETAKAINEIGWGLGKMGLSLSTFASPLTVAGMLGLSGLLLSLNKNKNTLSLLSELSTSMSNGGQGFKEFGDMIEKVTELKNNDKMIKELRNLIFDLNNLKIENPLNEIKELLSKPLKVEFNDKDVSMVINLTTQLDGKKIASSTYSHLVKLGINKSTNK